MWSIPGPEEAGTPALKNSPKGAWGGGETGRGTITRPPPSHLERQLILEVEDMAGGSLDGFQDSAESLGDWPFFHLHPVLWGMGSLSSLQL